MIETRADVTLPVAPSEAFEAVSDLDHADWLPAVRRLRHVGGPKRAAGARYEVEVGFLGRHLRGVLVCQEMTPPERMVMELEEGLELTITVDVTPVRGGCSVELTARYSLGGGPFGRAMEMSSQGPARREAARAVEQLAARFGRRKSAGASA
ncbi:MAG: SRPBCC family protein [Candidatus Dormibacteraeota bacterium]|nr:SRPBCC family protein [Candidatus Dormibacteraeota bacterium]